MSIEPAPIAERRLRVIARIADQRLALQAAAEPWRRPLAVADQGIAVARFVKSHPVWIVGSALAPSPSRLGAWVRRGFVAWQIVRRLRGRRSSA